MTGTSSNPDSARRSSQAAVTTPAGLGAACARCGATVATGSVACPRCGSAVTGSNAAEQAERIRLRLQEALGDSYRLLEILGRGGMGIVFRAHEAALDREVALKVLALDPILSPDAYARFEREAKLAARLDHPNIVPIFGVGQRNTVAYYTMRLVRGGTLEEQLDGHTALTYRQAIEILRDVARALDYAHGQGVIHRDIKPGNVLMGDAGHPMVSDFGIARAMGAGGGEGTLGSNAAVVGSPGYMAPEQWRGEEVDPQVDQYALGVMAFEMLTGHRPFETVKIQDLMRLHLSGGVPRASELRPALEPHVDAAIRRAMAKMPGDRFGTATAFIDALAGQRPAFGTRLSAPVAREPEQRGGSGLRIAFGLLTTAALATVLISTRRQAMNGATVGSVLGPAVHTVTPPVEADSTRIASTPIDPMSTAATPAPREIVPVARPSLALDTTLLPVRAPLVPMGRDAPGYIRVIVRGGAAKVRVDGHTYGFSPLVVRVDPGTHNISLEGAGDAFLPSQVMVEAVAKDTTPAVFAARIQHGPGDSGDSAASLPSATPDSTAAFSPPRAPTQTTP